MGFRRPEVQILSPRPSSEQGLHRLLRLFLQKSSRAHAAALPLSGRPAERPPRPAARGRLSCSAFSSFSFVKASREEVGGGPILSLPFPFDPLSRKRTDNGPPGSSACRRNRRPERAGGRGAGQIGRGAGGGINGGALMDTKEPGGKVRPAPAPDFAAAGRQSACRRDRRAGRGRQAQGGRKRAGRKRPPGSCAGWNAATGRQSARRWQAAGSRGRARAGISRWAQAARGRAGGGPRRGCTWNRSKASEWGTAS